MYYTYILFSQNDGKLYIGYTSDLKKRISAHNGGFVRATKNRRPLTLIYYEAYKVRSDAECREMYLKGGNGRKIIKIQLKDCLKKVKYKYR